MINVGRDNYLTSKTYFKSPMFLNNQSIIKKKVCII